MSVKIYKNFLTKEECQELTNLAFQGLKDGWFQKGYDEGHKITSKRYSNRMTMINHEYPEKILEINRRIKETLGLQNKPIIADHGKDGIVISISFEEGDVYSHKDPRSNDGLITYRCNILTQAAESGAQLYVEEELIEVEEGDLHCYAVSELEHRVTAIEGKTPRIMFMFGAHLTEQELEQITK
jgi:hypothetical protein